MRRDAGFDRSGRRERPGTASAWILVAVLAASPLAMKMTYAQDAAPSATDAASARTASQIATDAALAANVAQPATGQALAQVPARTAGGSLLAPDAGVREAMPFPGSGGIVLKLALSLGGVVVLILALQRVARRYGGALGAGTGSDKIRVISQRAIGPKVSLVLVQVADRTLLVGVSPQGIRRVADLGRSAGAAQPGAAPAPAGSVLDTVTPERPAVAWGGLRRLMRSRAAGRNDVAPAAIASAATALAATAPAPSAPAANATARPPDFEGELTRRLAALRSRYPSIHDLETEAEGGRA